eukprot:10786872-Lingulodinium_polyedra.AAC.1
MFWPVHIGRYAREIPLNSGAKQRVRNPGLVSQLAAVRDTASTSAHERAREYTLAPEKPAS